MNKEKNFYDINKLDKTKLYHVFYGGRHCGIRYREIYSNILKQIEETHNKIKIYEKFVKSENFKKYSLKNRIIFKKELRILIKLRNILAKKLNNIEVI